MNRILTLLFVFYNGLVFCQQPTVEWAKTFGGIYSDIARGVVVTPENDYIVVGTALEKFEGTESNGFGDGWVMKLNKEGKLLWKKNFGGTNDDAATTINATADGGYLIGGNTASNDGDIKDNKGDFDAWLFKIDKNGNLLWSKTFGGTGIDYKGDAFETKDGNIIFSMVSHSKDGDCPNNSGKEDCWIMKLDSKANVVWKSRFGGSDQDNIRRLVNIDDKTFIVVGWSYSQDGNFENSNGDFIIKYDSTGKRLWQKSFGSPDPPNIGYLNYLESATITQDKKYIIAVGTGFSAATLLGRGQNDLIVAKVDTSGNLIWHKFYGGYEDESGKQIISISSDKTIVLGHTSSNQGDASGNNGKTDFWLFELDKDGKIQWQKCMGGTKYDYAGNFALTKENKLIVIGETESVDNIFMPTKDNMIGPSFKYEML
jgi:hypothetical protein